MSREWRLCDTICQERGIVSNVKKSRPAPFSTRTRLYNHRAVALIIKTINKWKQIQICLETDNVTKLSPV